MTRSEFSLAYAKKMGISNRKAKIICESVMEFLADTIKEEDRIVFEGFGTFKKRVTTPRRIGDLFTGEIKTLPSKTKMYFEPSRKYAAIINGEISGEESDNKDLNS